MGSKNYNMEQWKNLRVQRIKDLELLFEDYGASFEVKTSVGHYKIFYQEESNPNDDYWGYQVVKNVKENRHIVMGYEWISAHHNILDAIAKLIKLVGEDHYEDVAF